MTSVKEKHVEITSLKLKLGQKEAELTIAEAKKLKKALEEIFGKEVVEKTEHHHHDWSYWRRPRHYDWGSVRWVDVYCADSATTKTGASLSSKMLASTPSDSRGVLSVDIAPA